MKRLKIIFFILLSILSPLSFAELHITLNDGIKAALPIAIVPFSGQNLISDKDDNIAQIINQDLASTGHFKTMAFADMPQQNLSASQLQPELWLKQHYDYLVKGQVTENNDGTFKVTYQLMNLVLVKHKKSGVVLSQSFTVPKPALRFAAHKISNAIYQELTGIKGIFNTRIAYVLVKRPLNSLPQYYLEVADADGYKPQTLVQSNEPLMSPAWSPNGKEIAYVSLANDKASIYLVSVASGQQRLISDFPGINGAPAWSPNSQNLAIVLSKTGHPKVYLYHLANGKLTQLTHGYSIDTEPAFAPDGKSIIFTSNRGGTPQIYQYNLASQQIQRLTFTGNYNARASFTADGHSIVVLHRGAEGFNIAIQNLKTGNLKVLTHNKFDSTPSVAPNGQMVVYANDAKLNSALQVVSTDGSANFTLPTPEGSVLEPAWSPMN